MRNPEHLFSLIKSLAPPEKRFFRIQAGSQGGDKGYLTLFDLLNKAETYDEPTLVRQWARRSGEAPAQIRKKFAYRKHYLYTQLMRSLRGYYQDKLPASEVMVSLINGKILMGKKIYPLARQELGKARKKARRTELLSFLVPVVEAEMEMAMRDSEAAQDWITPDKVDFESIMAELMAQWRLLRLHHYTQREVHNLTIVTGRKQELDRLFEVLEGIASSYDLPMSPLGKVLLYAYRSVLAIFRDGDFQRSSRLDRRIVQLMEGHPDLISSYPGHYSGAILRILAAANQLGRFDLFDRYVAKMEATMADDRIMGRLVQPQYRSVQVITLYRARFRRALEQLELDRIAPDLPEIEQFIDTYQPLIHHNVRMLLYHYFSLFHFYQEDWKLALRWTNRVLNEPKSRVPVAIHMATRILHLLTHFELGNFDLLAYLITNLKREHNAEGKYYQTELVLMEAFLEMANLPPGAEHHARLAQLTGEVEALKQDPKEQMLLNSLDLPTWLQSKVEGRSFLVLMREALVST